jgi:RNA polymerase sigma-70 factor (ECF subfamily)
MAGYTTPLTPEADSAIIAGCVKGERKYQEMLYHRYSSKMFAVCMRYANEYAGAEDMMQEGFIKVFKNIEKYRGEGSFEGWLRRIFINTSIEQYRKKSNMYVVQETEALTYEYYEDNAVEKLMKDDLVKVIQTLSTGYRNIFNLYVIEGYSHREIADMMGISEGTSKSQLARARYILQRKLSEILPGLEVIENEENG